MSQRRGSAIRWRRVQRRFWLILWAVLWPMWAGAQAPTPASTPMAESVHREADSPLRWIRLHADLPSRNPAPPNAAPAAQAAQTAQTAQTAPALKEAPAKPSSKAPAPSKPSHHPAERGAATPAVLAAPASSALVLARTPALAPAPALSPASAPTPATAAARPLADAASAVMAAQAQAAASVPALAPPANVGVAGAVHAVNAPNANNPAEPTGLNPLYTPEPSWPPELMAQLGQGRVRLRFEVNVQGRISHAEVQHSTDVRLNAAALAALNSWRFMPLPEAKRASLEFGFDP